MKLLYRTLSEAFNQLQYAGDFYPYVQVSTLENMKDTYVGKGRLPRVYSHVKHTNANCNCLIASCPWLTDDEIVTIIFCSHREGDKIRGFNDITAKVLESSFIQVAGESGFNLTNKVGLNPGFSREQIQLQEDVFNCVYYNEVLEEEEELCED